MSFGPYGLPEPVHARDMNSLQHCSTFKCYLVLQLINISLSTDMNNNFQVSPKKRSRGVRSRDLAEH
jgi:hypothetical protein